MSLAETMARIVPILKAHDVSRSYQHFLEPDTISQLYHYSPESEMYKSRVRAEGRSLFDQSGITVLSREFIDILKFRYHQKTAKLSNRGALEILPEGILQFSAEWDHRRENDEACHNQIDFLARPVTKDVVIASMAGFTIMSAEEWKDPNKMEQTIAEAYLHPIVAVRPNE